MTSLLNVPIKGVISECLHTWHIKNIFFDSSLVMKGNKTLKRTKSRWLGDEL